ncbi:MAG: hypothetical protein U0527_01535 [Candidatus Eisenbacteria bacterium]
MLREMAGAPTGAAFFARLASSAGIETAIDPLGDRLFRLPDGSTRYLVDEAYLADAARVLGGTLADPLKTTLVHGARSMTTWVLRKNGQAAVGGRRRDSRLYSFTASTPTASRGEPAFAARSRP